MDRGDGTERGREGQRCGIVLREEGCERMGNERGRGGWQVEGVGGCKGKEKKGRERDGSEKKKSCRREVPGLSFPTVRTVSVEAKPH